MNIQNNTIIKPLPTEELITKREMQWNVSLPSDYKDFIMKYNGGIPTDKSFTCDGRTYAITRFLCVLVNFRDNADGWYDISVVESQIGERLTDNEDLVGVEVLPIAEMFSGDYVCLDYRENKLSPSVCVWSHEESEDFSPVTYKIANSFTEFIESI